MNHRGKKKMHKSFVLLRMTAWKIIALAITSLLIASFAAAQGNPYLGFDSNDYPGDANLKALHDTFSYSGYWLNNPPGESSNPWRGHRAAIESAGFGFMVLFNGRLYDQLKNVGNAQRLGKLDASAAVESAKREGFPAKTIIFLDQEQGGRMLPEQKAYIYTWADEVGTAGFRAGIYCSGIPFAEDGNVVTANDVREHTGNVSSTNFSAARDITYWVFNDACPPAPGCSFPQRPPNPVQSGVKFAEVWQFAQSPQRKDVAGHCTNYNRDGNCYPPKIAGAQRLPVDLNTSISADPSHGRR
jgi:hypothetical protein